MHLGVKIYLSCSVSPIYYVISCIWDVLDKMDGIVCLTYLDKYLLSLINNTVCKSRQQQQVEFGHLEDTNLANAMSDDIAIVSAARTPIGENLPIFYIKTKSDQATTITSDSTHSIVYKGQIIRNTFCLFVDEFC